MNDWETVELVAAQFAGPALTNSVELAIRLRAGAVLDQVLIEPLEAFVGGAIATYTLSVGIAGSLAKFASAYSVRQAPGGSMWQLSLGPFLESTRSDTPIIVTAVSTAANLDAAISGRAAVSLRMSERGRRS